MKIVTRKRNEEELEMFDYRDFYEISIDEKISFFIQEGEPEDATLGRNMNDCYKIPELLKKAYEAGMRKEGFSIDGQVIFEIEK
jgi:hypothetical protein